MARPALVVASVKAEALIPEINANHRECTKSGHEALKYAQQAGELLWKLKETVKHGDFEQIVEQRCDCSLTTAKGYMRISDGLPKLLEKLGDEAPSEISIRGIQKLITEHSPPKSNRIGGAPSKSRPSGGSPGPQKGPASVPQIEAQTKQVEQELAAAQAAPEPEEPADKTEVGKKLKKINELIGQTIRTCDEVRSHMTAREYDAIYSSLDIACRELTACRARWRKMKVVG